MLYVVTGPPASGKSTWIRAHARPDDIVIDMDVLAVALSGPGADDHHYGREVREVAYSARAAALNKALDRLPRMKGTDVYLIHSMPEEKHLARYRHYGAKVVVVDPGEQVVRQRVRTLRGPGAAAVVTRWYRRHRASGGQPATGSPSRTW
jgi:predicted kinase